MIVCSFMHSVFFAIKHNVLEHNSFETITQSCTFLMSAIEPYSPEMFPGNIPGYIPFPGNTPGEYSQGIFPRNISEAYSRRIFPGNVPRDIHGECSPGIPGIFPGNFNYEQVRVLGKPS